MVKGDFREIEEFDPQKKKNVKRRIITSESGTEYKLLKRLGKGGVASVYQAERLSDHQLFAYKDYTPTEENAQILHGIHSNLKELIKNPIRGTDGTVLKSFVGPMEMVEFPKSKSFGYIMRLVDLSEYLAFRQIFHKETYPDAWILCEIGKNIAGLFRTLHLGRGWCYKDINEENIFIHPKTGDVILIDCDNISVPEKRTIFGTTRYLAPEIYQTSTPDTHSDKYSMAVAFYRLLVMGFPLDGKRTLKYLNDNDLDVENASPKIYGEMALFAFDPVDKSNWIKGLSDTRSRIQVRMWEALPERIRQRFIQTFSSALSYDKRTQRTTDFDWFTTFDEVQKNEIVTCQCGKRNFAGNTQCLYCDRKLPPLRKKKTEPGAGGTGTGRPGTGGNGSVGTGTGGNGAGGTGTGRQGTGGNGTVGTGTARQGANGPGTRPDGNTGTKAPGTTAGGSTKELTHVVFEVLRDVKPEHLRVTAQRKITIAGRDLHPELDADDLMKLQYGSVSHQLSALNLSRLCWKMGEGASQTTVHPGERVILRKDTLITILDGKLSLRVHDVR